MGAFTEERGSRVRDREKNLFREKTAEIQATRAIAQALSEHVETFLSSTVEKCFALAEIWMKYLSIAKAYEREICLVKKNLQKLH